MDIMQKMMESISESRNTTFGVNEEKAGDLKVTHAGNVRGKQWWVSVYDKEDGWISVPELESDSPEEAEKKAKVYSKKHKLGKVSVNKELRKEREA